jgi:hypothetical protein
VICDGVDGASRILAEHNAQKLKIWLLRGVCAQASQHHGGAVTSSAAAVPGRLLDIGSQLQTQLARSIEMNGMLNKVVGWFRAGYAAAAPQFGHAALLALCPEAAGVLRRYAT